MSPQKRTVESGALEVRFVGDDDVLDHIVEKHEGIKSNQLLALFFYFYIPRHFIFVVFYFILYLRW